MRYLFACLTVFVALVLLSPSFETLDVTAQDTSSGHPVVGMWRTAVTNEGDEPFTSLTTFHADGTYIEVLPDGLLLTGLWQATGERTADVTAYLNYYIEDELVEAEVRLSIEVDSTGNTLTEDGTVVGLYQDGTVALAMNSPATGTRLGILPVEPLGTPVLPGTAPAATPTS